MKISKANPNKPIRLLVYGVEGVGKSTLGAKADAPIFITPEGGADLLKDRNGEPVEKFDGMDTWDSVKAAVAYLYKEAHNYKTLVIDSADWLEKVCHVKIIAGTGKSIITCHGGYGNGYRLSETMHKEFIEQLSHLRDHRGMNIIVTAHAHVKPVKDPSMMEDYDSFEIKCHEMVSSLWREWVDALLFARFRTYVNTAGDTVKARAVSDGSRVVFTVKQPSFQAKNRYGLPPEMNFTEDFWKELTSYVSRPITTSERTQIEAAAIRSEIQDLSHVVDQSLQETVAKSVSDAGDDVAKLGKILGRLREIKRK